MPLAYCRLPPCHAIHVTTADRLAATIPMRPPLMLTHIAWAANRRLRWGYETVTLRHIADIRHWRYSLHILCHVINNSIDITIVLLILIYFAIDTHCHTLRHCRLLIFLRWADARFSAIGLAFFIFFADCAFIAASFISYATGWLASWPLLPLLLMPFARYYDT